MSTATKHSELSSILRWPTPTAKTWVEDYLSRCRNHEVVLAVIAVGSSVRVGVPSNDLDIVTIVQGSVEHVSERPPIEVDLRVYSSDTLEQKVLDGSDYIGWAVKFGKVLYQRRGFWTSLVAKLGGKVPLPSSQLARARATIALKHASDLVQVGDQDAALEQIISALTHVGRAVLIEAGIYPTSRPEIPSQLANAGNRALGELLRRAIDQTTPASILLNDVTSYLNKEPSNS